MLLDEYKDGGPWLRRWQLVAGQPRCVEDAISPDHPDANAVRIRNDRVRTAFAAVQSYEAARQVVALVEAGDLPAETIAVPVLVEGARQSPAHAAYLAALDLLTATSEEPPETVDMPGLGEVPNPGRAAWLAAQDLVAAGEPPETVTVLVEGIEDRPNPAWVSYRDALDLVAAADDGARALALLRATDKPPPEFLDDGAPNPDRAAWDAAAALQDEINALPVLAEAAQDMEGADAAQ